MRAWNWKLSRVGNIASTNSTNHRLPDEFSFQETNKQSTDKQNILNFSLFSINHILTPNVSFQRNKPNKNYFTPQSQAVFATTMSHKFSLHVVYLTILHVYKIRLRENSYCTGTNFRWKKCYRRFWYAKRTGSMLTLRNWFQKKFLRKIRFSYDIIITKGAPRRPLTYDDCPIHPMPSHFHPKFCLGLHLNPKGRASKKTYILRSGWP